jgi:Gluconate 2-dehydrogenase subunit 3
MTHSRRDFLKEGAAGATTWFTFAVAGNFQKLTPAQARESGVPYRTLNSSEVRTLEAFGQILVPGSATLGLAHFIDHQLSGLPANSMLMVKYLGVSVPFADFYKKGLSALEAAAQRRFSQPFTALNRQDAQSLVESIARGDVADWKGPPAPLFFFVLRNDAVDVTYGTVAGFKTLGIPYMAHVAPPTRWG